MPRDPIREDAPALANRLLTDGFLILPSLVAGLDVAALDTDLAGAFAETPFSQGGFYGERTRRFGRLLTRSPHAATFVMEPLILAICEAVLGPFCDTMQLNLAQGLAIHPGAGPQPPHRDQDMWRGETGTVEYLVNVMWPFTPYTEANGATLIWPGSQGFGLGTSPDDAPFIAEMQPGDALLFLGSTLHAGGANQTEEARRGMIVSYCLGWLKPYENQWLVYPPAIAKEFPPDLAALVGYRQHRPNLGNVDGQCPSRLFGDVAEPAGAIDALRPDQDEAVAEFLAGQP